MIHGVQGAVFLECQVLSSLFVSVVYGEYTIGYVQSNDYCDEPDTEHIEG